MTTTLFVILVFAVDFSVARDLLSHDRGSLSTYGLGFLPMATALVFGLYRILRLGARSDALTVGFVAVGLASAGGYLAAIRLVPALTDVMERLSQALDDRLLAAFPAFWEGDDLGLDELLVLGTVLSMPPVLLALAGGWFARRIALGREAAERHRERRRAWRRPRFTLASASILVAILAVDFGLIRHLLVAGPSFWTTFAIGFLPMANALVLGLPGLLGTRHRRGPFLIGFEVAGGLATAAYLAACAVDPVAMMGRLESFVRAAFAALDLAFGGGRAQQLFSTSAYAGMAAEVVLVVAFFNLPPLVVALSGGAITRRFGRRSARAA